MRIFNRSIESAETLARDFGPRVKVLPWEDRSRASTEAAVLVSTTSVGLKGAGTLAMDFTDFHPDCIVVRIVYVPREDRSHPRGAELMAYARSMASALLHQAVPGFEKWFGVRPKVTAELYELIAADIEAT